MVLRQPARLSACLALSALVLTGCSTADTDDDGYTPPVGGGATALPTQVAPAPTTPAAASTTTPAPSASTTAPSAPAAAPSSTGGIDDSAWRDIPATAEAQIPETSTEERRDRGSSPWVASQVVSGLFSSDYTQPRPTLQRESLRPLVSDSFWAYIGGPALSSSDAAGDAAWAKAQAAKRTVEVRIERAQANAYARAGGDEIVDVDYSTTTTENGRIIAREDKTISYLMVKDGQAWKVDQVVR